MTGFQPFALPISSYIVSSQTISHDWPTPVTHSSPASSLPPLDDGDPPAFEDSQYDEIVEQNPLPLSEHLLLAMGYSPTSSNEAEPDLDGSDVMQSSPQSQVAEPEAHMQDVL